MAECVLAVSPAHLSIVCEILRHHVPNIEVCAFGSRVTGAQKEYSDLDLAIMTKTPLSLATMGRLIEAFSLSNLPYKVDVVDWAQTSDAFRKIIATDRVIVQSQRD